MKGVQQAHEAGTEAHHRPPTRARSRSRPATTAVTTMHVPFAGPAALQFACHLPGHYAYGMRGLIRVA